MLAVELVCMGAFMVYKIVGTGQARRVYERVWFFDGRGFCCLVNAAPWRLVSCWLGSWAKPCAKYGAEISLKRVPPCGLHILLDSSPTETEPEMWLLLFQASLLCATESRMQPHSDSGPVDGTDLEEDVGLGPTQGTVRP